MKYRLFDEIERKDTGPEPESEAEYEYINRSARPDAQKIRSLLEDWFSRYPEKQNDFLRRFKSNKDKEHNSAFFELYTHEILIRQGFTCRVHPEIEGSSTRPEFLASYKELNFYSYVEATIPDLPQDDAINPGAAMIRRAIHKKASAYGNLGKPFLIAINVNNVRPFIRDSHVADALFGDLRLVTNPKTEEHPYRRDLRTATLIALGGTPEHTRVSGIIILKNLGPWSITQITPVLWHNAWAKHPFPPELWQLPQQIPKEVYEKKEGKAVSELLGLPRHWPED